LVINGNIGGGREIVAGVIAHFVSKVVLHLISAADIIW
jgi:hypothetical protein